MRYSGAFVVIAGLFITVLITSNIIVIKPIRLPFESPGVFELNVTAAILIFPVSYIIGDVLTEVYGFRRARIIIWLGFASNLFLVLMLWLAGLLPGASEWSAEDQTAYVRILGQLPGILVASFIAYLVGEFANATVLSLLKYHMRGRFLFVRTIGSTMVGQGLDSFLFIYIAFGFFNDWSGPALLGAALTQWVVKTIYETLATPLTYAVVTALKRKEQVDITDLPRSLNPLGIFA